MFQVQKFIAHLSYESLTLVSRPDSVETQNKETKTRAVKKVQNASDFKVFLDLKCFMSRSCLVKFQISTSVTTVSSQDVDSIKGIRTSVAEIIERSKFELRNCYYKQESFVIFPWARMAERVIEDDDGRIMGDDREGLVQDEPVQTRG